MIDITDKDGAVFFEIRVIPRSSRSEIVGEIDGALKIKVASPPVDGAANDEIVKLLAKKFDVAKSSVSIVSGHTSKQKRVAVAGVDAASILSILQGKSGA